MPRQIVKMRITVSREKLKTQIFQADSEKVTAPVPGLTEKERENFLVAAAEFLLSAMEIDGFLEKKESPPHRGAAV